MTPEPNRPDEREADVSTLNDLYWHITRNALKDGSPFAVACMAALPALDEAIARRDAPREGAEAAFRTLARLGYTFHGGQEWKPPIGPAPREGGEAVAWIVEHCYGGEQFKLDVWLHREDMERERTRYYGADVTVTPLYTRPHAESAPGFVLVPREPTPEMIAAACDACILGECYYAPEDDDDWRDAIRAAIAAAQENAP